jgi:hypothetical protein
MSNIRRIAASLFFSVALLGFSSPLSLAQPKPGHLDEVLRQMDAASLKFKSTEADFEWDLYEKVVKQVTTQQSGTIYFKKNNAKTVMGARMEKPSLKLIDYRDGTLWLFEVPTDHLTTVHSKGNQFEQFLTLGFGASGSDLTKTWMIADLGTETINGVEAAKMDLVPKDPQMRTNITHITIWVDPVRDISLKQVVYLPSDDYRTAVYTNIRYNMPVNEKQYMIKTDGKTTRDDH